jgi:hypothetical protein
VGLCIFLATHRPAGVLYGKYRDAVVEVRGDRPLRERYTVMILYVLL